MANGILAMVLFENKFCLDLIFSYAMNDTKYRTISICADIKSSVLLVKYVIEKRDARSGEVRLFRTKCMC